jgi:hypothetical protein
MELKMLISICTKKTAPYFTKKKEIAFNTDVVLFGRIVVQ